MRFYHLFLPVCMLGLMLASACRNTTAVDNPIPGQVAYVEKSADTAAVELGIDADDAEIPDPVRNGVFLQWHAIEDNDLAAYDVYRRSVDTTGSFVRVGTVQQAFGVEDTSFLDTGAELEILYYYHVIARDDDGQEGQRSINDYYTLLPKPTLNFPTNRNQVFTPETDILFDWTFAGIEISDFVFRLEREILGGEYEVILVNAFTIEASVDPHQQLNLSETGAAELLPGTYRWRVEVIKTRDSRRGAEATWGFFVIN